MVTFTHIDIFHIKNGLAKEMARYKHEHDEKRENQVESTLHKVDQLIENHIPNEDKHNYTRATTSTEET